MKQVNQKNLIWNAAKRLGNLNFSIMMFLLIACISIFGTVIQQDQTLLYYQTNYPIKSNVLFSFNWRTIIFLGMDHIYATWWFLSILLLFFLSLIICTFSRQLPALSSSRNWKFLQPTKSMQKLTDFKSFDNKSLCNIIYSLHTQNYYVFHKGSCLYAYRGLLGRIAPIFVHISIILTLIGSVIGFWSGFMVQEMIPNHEIFHIHNVVKSGFKSQLPQNLIGKINNFYIEYNQDNSIKQFFSYISLLDNQGNYICNKQISVNSPLIFNGITFYQTDWQINALRFRIGSSKIVQKRLNSIKLGNKNLWICTLPISKQDRIILVITSLQEKIFIYKSNGQLIAISDLNEKIIINNVALTLQEIMTSTGLQIKTDPGIILVYTGFLVLIISVITSYLSYSQIWIKSSDNGLELAGSTNRAALTFEEDFISIQQQYVQSICKTFK